MKLGWEISYFQLSLLLFILILFILLFMINDRVLTEYFLFVELGQVIAITILIILAIIGYIQIKKENDNHFNNYYYIYNYRDNL